MRVNMDQVARLVRQSGYAATVYQTGGHCATLYADLEPVYKGTHWPRPSLVLPGFDDARFQVVMGPGWFELDETGRAIGWGDTEELNISIDDDGVSESTFLAYAQWMPIPEGQYAKEIIERLHRARVASDYVEDAWREHEREGKGTATKADELVDDLTAIALSAARKMILRLAQSLEN